MSTLDLLGLVGVGCIVAAYFLLQTEKMRFDDWPYLWLNAAGATAITLTLIVDFNLSALAMEVFWLLISLYGILKRVRRG